MPSFEDCEKIFEDKVLAQLISSYRVRSFDDIYEIKIRLDEEGSGGFYNEVSDFNSYGEGIKSLKGIENLKNLHTVILDYHKIKDFDLPLSLKQQLRVLRINSYGNYLLDSIVLDALDSIEELDISFSNDHHLHKIANFSKLKSLKLSCSEVYDFLDLSLLNKDCRVELEVVNTQMHDLNLGECNLISLDLENSILDIEKLFNISFVKRLKLVSCNLKHTHLVEEMRNLMHLEIRKCKDLDIKIIKSFLQLKHLDLSENNFTTPILEMIDLPELKRSFVSYNDLKTLIISNCITVRSLYLQNNNLKKLFITNCPDLRNLECDSNLLTEIALSGEYREVKSVDLRNNQISDLSGLMNIRPKNWLILNNNPILSLNTLKSFRDTVIHLQGIENLDLDEIEELVESFGNTLNLNASYLSKVNPIKEIKDFELAKLILFEIYLDTDYHSTQECFKYSPRKKVTNIFKIPYELNGRHQAKVKSFEGIEIFENLECICIRLDETPVSLKPLTKLKRLRRLILMNVCVEDIESLREIDNLENCIFSDCVMREQVDHDKLELMISEGVPIELKSTNWIFNIANDANEMFRDFFK